VAEPTLRRAASMVAVILGFGPEFGLRFGLRFGF
jgi:hypothetical protein